jgi:hypothetical protein
VTRLDPTDPTQLQVWADSLARTSDEQIAIIKGLLDHEVEDEMSALDRVFARAALKLLEQTRAA